MEAVSSQDTSAFWGAAETGIRLGGGGVESRDCATNNSLGICRTGAVRVIDRERSPLTELVAIFSALRYGVGVGVEAAGCFSSSSANP